MINFKYNYSDFFFLVFILAMPFVIADVPYIDDLARLAVGYGWNQDGRVFATFLMKTLSLGYPLMDISPIPTLLAISALVLSGYIIAEVLCINGRISKAIVATSMVSGPFIVQNLSYQWDSLPMALSMLLVVAPMVLINHRVKFIILASVSLTLSMYLYQATIFAFPCLAIIYLWNCIELKSRVEIVKLLVTFSLAAIAFVVIYKLSTLCINLEYKQARAELVIFSGDPISNFLNNTQALKEIYRPYFASSIGRLVLLSYVLSVITVCAYSYSNKNIYAIIGIFIPPVLMVIASLVGILIVNAPVSPRVFSALPISLLAIAIIANKSRYSFIIIGLVITFTTIIQLYAYVNALKSEYELQKSIAFQVAAKTDLYHKNIIVNGAAPLSKAAEITLKHLPYLKGSIPIYIQNGWVWGRQFMENEGLIFKEQYFYSPDFDKKRRGIINALCDLPVTNKNIHYNIRSNESTIVIDFKKNQCN